MSFGLTYTELRQLFRRLALQTPMARAIARKADLRVGTSSGTPYTVAIRAESWNMLDGDDPISAESHWTGFGGGVPGSIRDYPPSGWSPRWWWMEGFTECRVVAKTYTPHPDATLMALFSTTGEVFQLPDTFGGTPLTGQVWCYFTEEINASVWAPIHPNWILTDLIMVLFLGAGSTDATLNLGVCELQLR